MAHPLAWTVSRNLEEHHLLSQGDRLILCVSGGCDSIALLHLLQEVQPKWQLEIHLLHFNHGMRSESEEEEAFVVALANQLGLPCSVCRHPSLHQQKTKIQETARHWRLSEAARLMSEVEANAIAMAHHQGDQTETMLLKLLRGCHLTQIKGMDWKQGDVIRPLLNISKQMLQSYLEAKNHRWCQDASNTSNKYQRNRVRNELIPLLEELSHHSLETRLQQWEQQSQDIHTFLESQLTEEVRERLQSPHVCRQWFEAHPRILQSDFLRYWIEQQTGKSLDAQPIQQVLLLLENNPGSWESHLPHGLKVTATKAEILLQGFGNSRK